jgi:hypothetical protein
LLELLLSALYSTQYENLEIFERFNPVNGYKISVNRVRFRLKWKILGQGIAGLYPSWASTIYRNFKNKRR